MTNVRYYVNFYTLQFLDFSLNLTLFSCNTSDSFCETDLHRTKQCFNRYGVLMSVGECSLWLDLTFEACAEHPRHSFSLSHGLSLLYSHTNTHAHTHAHTRTHTHFLAFTTYQSGNARKESILTGSC